MEQFSLFAWEEHTPQNAAPIELSEARCEELIRTMAQALVDFYITEAEEHGSTPEA
jgi:hypothetical protein